MKNNWQTKKLGEIIVENKKSTLKSKGNKEGNYPFFVSGFNIKSIDKYLINEESIFLPTGGNFFIHYFNGKAAYSTDTWSIKTNKDVKIRFLYYFLSLNEEFVSKKLFKGATIKHLQKNDFRDIQISLPPLPEQHRIVKILDEVFENIAKAKENVEKNLQNSKDLFESYLQSVFTKKDNDWEEKRLGDVCDTGAGGTPLKAHKDYYENGNIPWLRSGEVCKKEITKTELFITEKGFRNSSASLFPQNTVLVAMYGATAGQTGILRFEATTNQAVCGILPNKDFLPEFIYYFFSANKKDLVRQAVGGAQPNISQIKIKNTFIPILSIIEQKSIVAKLDALSAQTKKLEEIYKQKLADLEELKKSFLKKAFSGEL